jgi:hypothetical protein
MASKRVEEQTVISTERGAKPRMSMEDDMGFGLRFRLSAMMFLQYAIWGAWAPVLWPYLTGAAPHGLGMSNPQAAVIFSLLPLANILAPFTGGQIADRLMPTQIFLGIVHLIGGAYSRARLTALATSSCCWLCSRSSTPPPWH